MKKHISFNFLIKKYCYICKVESIAFLINPRQKASCKVFSKEKGLTSPISDTVGSKVESEAFLINPRQRRRVK